MLSIKDIDNILNTLKRELFMISSDYKKKLENAIHKSGLFLLKGLKSFVTRDFEVERIARVAGVLLKAGYSSNMTVFDKVISQVLSNQKEDGGLRNTEETVWCIEVLKHKSYYEDIERAYEWLVSQRHASGGWGQNDRDFARIPLTSFMILFNFQLVNEKDIDWLLLAVEDEVFSSPFFLTYKISLPLIALKKRKIDIDFDKWYHLLVREQNDDGGFGPWKNHPVGSDILSTAYAAMALSQNSKHEFGFTRALNWILENQLDDGSWAYHYIDHGTSMGLLALDTVLKDAD